MPVKSVKYSCFQKILLEILKIIGMNKFKLKIVKLGINNYQNKRKNAKKCQKQVYLLNFIQKRNQWRYDLADHAIRTANKLSKWAYTVKGGTGISLHLVYDWA